MTLIISLSPAVYRKERESSLPERMNAMRHKLKISVSKEPQTGGVVRCRSVTLREKMLTRLLGRKERVMILIPGNTVESLDITELPEGGAACE